jgi:hypothetical protein
MPVPYKLTNLSITEPCNSTSKRKRSLAEISAALPTREELARAFNPLQNPPREPRLNLPTGLNIESSYALFSLFIGEDMFEKISESTNEYARRKRVKLDDAVFHEREWKDTNAAEIKVFFAILIYMGVHRSPQVEEYWNADPGKGPLHAPRLYMTYKRFQQLKRFLKVSNLNTEDQRLPNDKIWWYKVEPLATEFQSAAKKYYTPGSKVSIDEIMIRCFGRTLHTVKMPNKPIKQGYKVFAIAEHGYIWTFAWSSRLWGIIEMFRYPAVSPTGSMVLNMITELPGIPGQATGSNTSWEIVPYSVYMDNYFTSVALFQELRNLGCGACGTARPKSGIPPILVELKDHVRAIPWGSLFVSARDNVLCLAWQDNNVVFGLSTIHSPDDFVLSNRKRPAKTSTNAAIARAPFGDEVRRQLEIPIFIDDYNHHMGGIDIANQYRSSYETHRKGERNWLPILYFFLDAAIINAFRIQCVYKAQQRAQPLTHLAFRERLYRELFAFALEANTDLPPQRLNAGINHLRIRLKTRRVCLWCQAKKKLGLSSVQRLPRSNYGCSTCGEAALCTKGRCWVEFHTLRRLGS